MMLCREGVVRIGTRMGFDFNHKWQKESDLDHILRAGRETTRDRSTCICRHRDSRNKLLP